MFGIFEPAGEVVILVESNDGTVKRLRQPSAVQAVRVAGQMRTTSNCAVAIEHDGRRTHGWARSSTPGSNRWRNVGRGFVMPSEERDEQEVLEEHALDHPPVEGQIKVIG